MPALGDLQEAFRLIDAANSADPTQKEILYSERMSGRLSVYLPSASDLLQIAVRAQHIERWTIRRDRFPAGRRGYLRWRTALANHHAQRTTELMRLAGYDDHDAATVATLLRKHGLAGAAADADVQVLEDVACLVFVEHYLEDFSANQPEEKVAQILDKSLAKMSARGREAAAGLLARRSE